MSLEPCDRDDSSDKHCCVRRDFALAPGLDRALAAQGVDPTTAGARSRRVLDSTRHALAEAQPLMAPAVVYRHVAITSAGHDGVTLAGGARLGGPALASVLIPAAWVVAAVCTIGSALEDRATQLLATDPLKALALDGVGSAAVEQLARMVCGLLAAEATAMDMRATQPLSPGMSGWALADGQPQLFELVDARRIGVSLSESCVMSPRKSLSMIVGLGPNVSTGGRVCALCGMGDACRFQYDHA